MISFAMHLKDQNGCRDEHRRIRTSGTQRWGSEPNRGMFVSRVFLQAPAGLIGSAEAIRVQGGHAMPAVAFERVKEGAVPNYMQVADACELYSAVFKDSVPGGGDHTAWRVLANESVSLEIATWSDLDMVKSTDDERHGTLVQVSLLCWDMILLSNGQIAASPPFKWEEVVVENQQLRQQRTKRRRRPS